MNGDGVTGRHDLAANRAENRNGISFAARCTVTETSTREEKPMGLLDTLIAGAVRGAFRNLDASALPSVLSAILARTDLGSLGGLLQVLQQAGLDRQVGSWLGQGHNLPVSPDQLRHAIGDDRLSQLGQQSGLSIDQLLEVLAQHLPQTIDRMSPNGSLQEDPMATGAGPEEGGGGSLADQAGLDDIDRR